MIKRLTLLLISILYWGISELRHAVRRLAGQRQPGTCIVLYYHGVSSDERHRFEMQMEKLAGCCYPVSIDAPLPLEANRRYAAVTFDDGLESTVKNALPVLERLAIPAAIFVLAGYLGKEHPVPERTEGPPERILTSDALVRLDTKWVTIGSHGISHKALSSLDGKTAKGEMVRSREMLEGLVGKPVHYFSFPHGDFCDDHVRWAREAGYDRVFSSNPSPAFFQSGEFVTGRVGVHSTDWTVEFHLKIRGGYSWKGCETYRRWKERPIPRWILSHIRTTGNGA